MGLKCRIIRNTNGSLDVFDDKGTPSTLFQGLLRHFRSQFGVTRREDTLLRQEMLQIRNKETYRSKYMIAPNGALSNLTESQWELVRTPIFIARFGNWQSGQSNIQLDENGEPSFSENGLNEEETYNALSESTPTVGAESKALLLWGLANNANFRQQTGFTAEPTAQQMIYFYENYGDGKSVTPTEINDLREVEGSSDVTTEQLIFSNLKKDSDKVIKSVNNTDGSLNYLPEEPGTTIQNLRYQNSERSVIGQPIMRTSSDILKDLDNVYLGAVEDESDITDLASQLPESLYEQIICDTALQRTLFNQYRSLIPAVHYRIENGNLVEQRDTRVRQGMQNTILQNVDLSGLQQNLNVLTQLSVDTIGSELPIVQRLLRSVEKQAVGANIDVVGLTNLSVTKSYEELQNYLSALKRVVDDIQNTTATEESINTFLDTHVEYFGISEEIRVSPVRNTDNSPVIILEGQVDPVSAFTQNGLIQISDNVWMPVDVQGTLDTLVNSKSPEIPQYLYEGTALGSTALRNNIIAFFRQQPSALFGRVTPDENAMYNMAKYLYIREQDRDNMPIEDLVSLNNMALNNTNMIEVEQFVPTFQNFILNQKLNNTSLYNNVLKYFYIDDSGINVDAYSYNLHNSLDNWQSSIPMIEELYNYAATTENRSLLDVLKVESETMINPNKLAALSIMNPQVIPVFTGNYTKVSNTAIQLQDYAGDVITVGGIQYYISDYNTLIYSMEIGASDSSVYETATTELNIEHDRKLTTAQLQTIDNEIDQCG